MTDGITRAYTHEQRRQIAAEWYPFEPTMSDTSPWIDVRDRMPEEGVRVLVASTVGGKRYVTVGHRDGRYWCDDERSDFAYCGGDVVTHWIPLPDPPPHVSP